MYETSRQSRFDARYWMLGAGALGRPRGLGYLYGYLILIIQTYSLAGNMELGEGLI